jgi:hypothetical protein
MMTPRMVKKAGLLQVAKIILSGLFMVGRNKTWQNEGDGARATPAQIVVGALIGGIVLIVALLLLVRVVIGLATA